MASASRSQDSESKPTNSRPIHAGNDSKCPIHVLHLITGLARGGTELLLERLVTSSDRAAFRHTVVSMMDEGPIGARIVAKGVKVYALNVPRGRFRIGALLRLVRIIHFESPDIIQTWLYHADLAGLLANVTTGALLVWNVRSAQHDGLHRTLPRLCAAFSGLPAAVVVNSAAGKTAHEDLGYRPKLWKTIQNGFDTDQFKPSPAARLSVRRELGLDESAVLVGLVARFDPNKDHNTFFRAANELLQRRPGVHFVLVGDGIAETNRDLVSALQAVHRREAFHLLGGRDDIPRLTAALDIATSCSHGEAFPNTVGEAMACGVSVVVTAVGDSPRLVGTTGVVIPSRDPSALADAWEGIIDLSSEQRAAVGQAARDRIVNLFSLDAMVRQYEAFYNSLAAATSSAAALGAATAP